MVAQASRDLGAHENFARKVAAPRTADATKTLTLTRARKSCGPCGRIGMPLVKYGVLHKQEFAASLGNSQLLLLPG